MPCSLEPCSLGASPQCFGSHKPPSSKLSPVQKTLRWVSSPRFRWRPGTGSWGPGLQPHVVTPCAQAGVSRMHWLCSNTLVCSFPSQETRPNSWSAMRRGEYSAGPQRVRRRELVEALAWQPRALRGSSTKQKAQTQCQGRQGTPSLPCERSPRMWLLVARATHPELWPWIARRCTSTKQIHAPIGAREQSTGKRGTRVPTGARNHT